MIRQRLRARSSSVAGGVARLLGAILGAALAWYGAMAALLAFRICGRASVQRISGYRTVYDRLTAIDAHNISGTDRIIVAVAGLLCLIVFGRIAWRAIPRPYLARAEVDVTPAQTRGTTLVTPRAVERAAEFAALAHPHVLGARGRFATSDLDVAVALDEASALRETLTAVQGRVADALRTHELPVVPISVTLTGFERSDRREHP